MVAVRPLAAKWRDPTGPTGARALNAVSARMKPVSASPDPSGTQTHGRVFHSLGRTPDRGDLNGAGRGATPPTIL